MNLRLAWLGLLFGLFACSSSHGPELKVRVVTGLVPYAEFSSVRTELFSESESGWTSVATADAVAAIGTPFARGQIVATFPDVASGDYVVTTSLLRSNGSQLVAQTSRFSFRREQTVTLIITRDCVGVECPAVGGSPALQACLAGTCVDPRCVPGDSATEQYCETIDICSDNAPCPPVAACARNQCVSGICISEALSQGDDACDLTTQWCDPSATSDACRPLPGLSDAGADDGGILCGSICTTPGNVCFVGYWRCSDGGAPECADFVHAPRGFACAGGTCDGAGACVASSMDGGVDASDAGGDATDARVDARPDGPSYSFTLTPDGERVSESLATYYDFIIYIDAPNGLMLSYSAEINDPSVCVLMGDSAGPAIIPDSALRMNLPVRVTPVSNPGVTGTRECILTVRVGDQSISRSVLIDDESVQRISVTNADADWNATPTFLDHVFIDEAGEHVIVGANASNITGVSDPSDGFMHTYLWTRSTASWRRILVPRVGAGIPDGSTYSPAGEYPLAISPNGDKAVIALLTREETMDMNVSYHVALTAIDGLLGSTITASQPIEVTEAPSLTSDSFNPGFAYFSADAEQVYFSVVTNTGSGPHWEAVRSPTPAASSVWNPTTISTTESDGVSNGHSLLSGVSADGRYIAFFSNATDFVPGFAPDQESFRPYIKDLMTGELFAGPSDIAYGEVPPGSFAFKVCVSGRERKAYLIQIFMSSANVIEWDLDTGTFASAPTRIDGTPITGGQSTFMILSRDERVLSFIGLNLPGLLDGDDATFSGSAVFLMERVTNDRRVLNVTRRSSPMDQPGGIPMAISGDGRFTVFGTGASLESGDTNSALDFYIAGAM